MDKLNPDHVAWSLQHFLTLRDGGTWGIPRSGLIFTKRGVELQLTARMPHDPAMPVTAEQLIEQQQSDYDLTKRHFESAGITVIDLTPEGKTK
jgi:hypothetical protein